MAALRSLHSLQLIQGLALVLLVGITGITGTVGLVLSERWSAEALRIDSLLRLAEEARGDLYRQTKELFDYHFLNDPDAAEEYRVYGEALAAKLAELDRLANKPEEKAVITGLITAQEAARIDADAIMARESGRFDDAEKLALLDTELEVGSLAAVEAALDRAAREFSQARGDLQQRVSRLSTIGFGVLLLVLIAAAGLLLYARGIMQRAFIAPLSELLRALAAFGAGRLDSPVEERGAAEMVTLQRAINAMTDEVAQSRMALVRSEKQAALGALVPVVAHNIRNPLASIRATAQVLPDASDEAAKSKATKDILSAVDRLNAWLTSLLSYLDPGGAHRKAGRLATCADTAISLLAAKLTEKEVTVTRQAWDDGGKVSLDANLMEQAIYGLLVNAAEASPQGGRLKLTAGSDETMSWLSISDQGSGLPFSPSADGVIPGPTTKAWGSGLGIPFAYKICELHDGTLQFDDVDGGGTRATISLPALAA